MSVLSVVLYVCVVVHAYGNLCCSVVRRGNRDKMRNITNKYSRCFESYMSYSSTASSLTQFAQVVIVTRPTMLRIDIEMRRYDYRLRSKCCNGSNMSEMNRLSCALPDPIDHQSLDIIIASLANSQFCYK
jgi:hypothetical protein